MSASEIEKLSELDKLAQEALASAVAAVMVPDAAAARDQGERFGEAVLEAVERLEALAARDARAAAPLREQLNNALFMQAAQASMGPGRTRISAQFANRAGDDERATMLFERAIAGAWVELALKEASNRLFANPWDTATTVTTIVDSRLEQADVLERRGRIGLAERARAEALAVARERMEPARLAEVKRQLAGALAAQGRYAEALTGYAEVRDAREAEADDVAMARITADMVNLLRWLGDTDRAQAELDHARAYLEPFLGEGGDPARGAEGLAVPERLAQLASLEFEVDHQQALLFKETERYDESLELFERLWPKAESFGAGATVPFHRASILVRRGRHAEALPALREMEPVFRGDPRLVTRLHVVLRLEAQALTALGRAAEALATLEAAFAAEAEHPDSSDRWQLHRLRGEALAALDRPGEALDAWLAAAREVSELRRRPLGYRLDSTFLADKIGLFDRAVALACRLRRPSDCAELMEMVKSRALAVVLGVPEAAGGAGALERRFEELSRAADAFEYQAFQGRSGAEARRREVLAERAALLERMRIEDPRWRSVTEAPSLDLESLGRSLADSGRAALSLYLAGETVYAVLLEGGRMAAEELTLGDEIRGRLEAFIENLHSDEPSRFAYDLSGRFEVEAGDLVPPELLDRALAAEALVVVPHGPLHLLPWSCLLHGNRRLFERTPVGVLPNLSALAALDYEPAEAPAVALIGAPDYADHAQLRPLEGAEEEMRQISALYTPDRLVGEPLAGPGATEAAFWRLAGVAQARGAVLHMACHGTLDAESPMDSGLLLSGSKVDAAELARRRLPYDEVVLSACSTGWRPTAVGAVRLVGDDALGLPGALLESGARAVLVSVPEAQDEAASELTVRYHRHRAAGSGPLRALRAAQLELLESADHPPFLWAGFTMYGCR